ncbi:hypothetical protein BJX96DRAFT_68004 [Aspergillus floccosus]
MNRIGRLLVLCRTPPINTSDSFTLHVVVQCATVLPSLVYITLLELYREGSSAEECCALAVTLRRPVVGTVRSNTSKVIWRSSIRKHSLITSRSFTINGLSSWMSC